MGTREEPICLACGNPLGDLSTRYSVSGVPGHFHVGCSMEARKIQRLYRAGLIAGLREAADIATSASNDFTNQDETMGALHASDAIRARITALEEEKES